MATVGSCQRTIRSQPQTFLFHCFTCTHSFNASLACVVSIIKALCPLLSSYFAKSAKVPASKDSQASVATQRSSKLESESPKGAGDKKSEKRPSRLEDDDDTEQDACRPQENQGSPVMKRRSLKGRRVLQDSDNEGDGQSSIGSEYTLFNLGRGTTSAFCILREGEDEWRRGAWY